MTEVVNAGWMYALAAIIVVFVLTGSFAFIVKSFRDAKRIEMDPKKLRKTIIASALFTLLPSISILIGVVALSGIIGVPLPWIRLSVIGALHYEGAAVDAAYDGITLASMTPEQFVTIAFVMTLGILSGPLFCLFGFKAYDKKILAKAKKQEPEETAEADAVEAVEAVEETVPADTTVAETAEVAETVENAEAAPAEAAPKKRSFGPILFSAAFIAMICAFLAEDIAKIKNVGKIGQLDKNGAEITALGTYIPLIVIATAFVVTGLVEWISKKLKAKWLESFSLGLGMIAGMAIAVILG